jgi:hypothetical protein
LSIDSFQKLPDRYRDTYQSGGEIKAGRDGTMSGAGGKVIWGRKESGHVILRILSKLGIPWKREGRKLPGWGDEL